MPTNRLERFAHNLDWNLLRTFIVVVEEGSITRAANRLLLQQLGLVDEVRHPGSAALGVAFEVVAIEQADLRAIAIEDVEDPHFALVDGQVFPFAK